jgi:gamma-glutamyltranspeptidase / glutathione hydrolase / leukotriene-C4 hydrolase
MFHLSYREGSRADANWSYENAAVTTEGRYPTEVGVNVLKRGGNAVDAAIAAAICVGVVNSFSSGIGGGGFMLIKKLGDDAPAEMYDFRETAPRRLTPAVLEATPLSTQKSGLSVAVPGEIRGFHDVHSRHGKLPWTELLEESIAIARGFPATRELVKRLNRFKNEVLGDPGLSGVYTRNNEIIEEGDIVVRENYARTLEEIARSPESFYHGEIAEKIVAAVAREGGVLEMDDLRGYRMLEREALVGTYKDYAVYTTSLPTSGASVIQALNILENFDVEKIYSRDKNAIPGLVAEVLKFVAARRGEFADPDFMENWRELVGEVTSKSSAKAISDLIDAGRTLPGEAYSMKKIPTEDHGTTHVNVVDEDGMLVLLTTTINLEFGAKFMDPETGIIFNNEIDDFYVKGVTNYFGLGEMPENTVEPFKRPFSSAAPAVLIKDDEVIALGATGGTYISTSVIYTLMNLLLGLSLRDSILAPRLHHQFTPMNVFVESTFPPEGIKHLEAAGHKVVRHREDVTSSAVFGIRLRYDENGNRKIEAFSDPRKDGGVSGY